jgi:hypothetical protein
MFPENLPAPAAEKAGAKRFMLRWILRGRIRTGRNENHFARPVV